MVILRRELGGWEEAHDKFYEKTKESENGEEITL
jgi:hypothetical protein